MRRKSKISPECRTIALLLLLALSLVCAASAQDTNGDPCPRPAAGSKVTLPPEIHSQNGRLEVTLNFEISEDAQGLLRFCYVTDEGLQAPTLRLKPGDELVIHLHNKLRADHGSHTDHPMGQSTDDCAEAPMSLAATNLHFHGLNVPPTCHQDDVMRTLIGPGTTFDYKLTIPRDATPGLYWYHPHPHPFGETQVQGGASGALIVEGLESVDHEIAGLPERVLILRDQKLGMKAQRQPGSPMPGWDVSLNYVPVTYPDFTPAIVETTPRRREFWRVLNAAADTIFDLQMVVNGVPRPIRLLAIDGVPLSGRGAQTQTDVLLPPGSRAEFIVITPKPGDHAELVSKGWDTGPDGENDPMRPLASIVLVNQMPVAEKRIRKVSAASGNIGRSASLRTTAPIVQRKLYFSEIKDDPKFGTTSFYLTVDGHEPARFTMSAPPNIVTRQGSVEDWTIENRSREEHVFHIHQVHFQVMAIDGKRVDDPAVRDTVDLPYWKGEGPYPSVKLRMDFRSPNAVGTLMYHCHILQHSSNGMMGTIQVLPSVKGKQIGVF